MRVNQSERSDYDRHERRKERFHRVSREDRWRNHMPSKDKSEGRTYSEYMESARNARRHGRDERRHERPIEHKSSDENERKNERRDRRNDKNDRRDERNERDREIDRDIIFTENKLRIPTFHDKSNVEAYLDWELKIE